MNGGHRRISYMSAALALVAGVGLAGCDLSSTSQSSGASPSASSAQSSPSPQAGSSASPAANGPTGVVDQYWRSLKNGDCNTAYGVTVDPARAKLIAASNLCRSIQLDSVQSYQIGDVTGQTATTAMVKVTVVRGSGTRLTPTMVVTLVGGSWKISDIQT